MTDTDDDALIAQYEAYPYPPRAPEDEKRRLITGSPSHLAEVNHYVFGGRRDFSQPFRALVAGGGTGDAAIMLAQQLADKGGSSEVVYLDLSRAAADIVTARAKVRGLGNIRFVQGSLMDLPSLGLGQFDYIDCCGVLHHLERPEAGLARLGEVLADGGGMGLMVYAPYGRTGVYHVQALLRMLGEDGAPPDRLARARGFVADLPSSNWLKRNPLVEDHIGQGDAGFYDLLLHSRDRAFSVPEVASLVEAAGFAITGFVEPLRYDPLPLIQDADSAARVRALPWIERCAFAELMTGSLKTHVFYVVRPADADGALARPGPDMVPVPVELDVVQVAPVLQAKGELNVDLDGAKISLPMSGLACALLARIDGERSIAAIRGELARMPMTPDGPAMDAAFEQLFVAFNGLNVLFLRAAETE